MDSVIKLFIKLIRMWFAFVESAVREFPSPFHLIFTIYISLFISQSVITLIL